jgi:hypothetical protein
MLYTILDWRRNSNRLPKGRVSLNYYKMDKVQKNNIMSVSHIQLSKIYRVIKNVSVHLTITVHTNDDLNMAITEHIRNVDHAILRTQFGVPLNAWRLAGDTLNITCNFLYWNYQVHRDFLITMYIFQLRYSVFIFGFITYWKSCTLRSTL